MDHSPQPLEGTNLLAAFLKGAGQIILGKEAKFHLALAAILARGHILLEDEPGMGKTTFAKTLAQLLDLKFKRIQFTSDLLPADILGGSVFGREGGEFRFVPGPIFSQVVLGDELNRASPRTQSAVLEAMEEGAVSVDGITRSLGEPFLFVATQNPQKSFGTFPLPESQLDRFLIKMGLGYPSREAEAMLLGMGSPVPTLGNIAPVMTASELTAVQGKVQAVKANDRLLAYLLDLVALSRQGRRGLSPRAALGLLAASKAWAYLEGRKFVVPEDVQAVAAGVIAHRLAGPDSSEDSAEQERERAEDLLRAVPAP